MEASSARIRDQVIIDSTLGDLVLFGRDLKRRVEDPRGLVRLRGYEMLLAALIIGVLLRRCGIFAKSVREPSVKAHRSASSCTV
jgi:hypothetical protein